MSFQVVRDFENEVAHWFGAPYGVAVDCCTHGIELCLRYNDIQSIEVPKRTYLSVPQSIRQAGGDLKFEDLEWQGVYQLKPFPVYDSAKRLTSNMYIKNSYMCLSFHIKKQLPIWKGGAILCDNKEAYEWFKKAWYEGRSEKYYKDDDIEFLGWNMYMAPQQAAQGLAMMQNYPEHKEDLDELNGYRDLTEFTVFKNNKIIIWK